MNADVKEVVLTLLQGRQYIFSLFHTLLGDLPTTELCAAAAGENSLRAVALFAEDASEAPKKLLDVLTLLQWADKEALKGEYTHLFLGPNELPAPPWESVYMGSERALFQASTLAVHKWYEQYGYVPKSYPHAPDDHISLMMHFLALLCGRAVEALQAEQWETYRDLLAAQLLFEQNHLMNWLPTYAADMQKSQTKVFYPQLAEAVRDMIAYDNSLLLEIMDSEQR